MKANVGTIDRVLRILAGVVLIALTLTGTIGLWGWIGLVPLATGVFRFCPLYPLLGMIITFYALFALLMMLNLKQSLTEEYAQSAWLNKRLAA